MRNQIIKKSTLTTLILTISFISFSCTDELDVVPKDQLTDTVLWSSSSNADLFLNNAYGSVPTMNSYDSWENFSDNSMNGQSGRPSLNLYATSNYTPSNAPNQWAYFAAIRKCNVFIKNVGTSDLSEDWKKVRLAEARYLRAYFYSLLWTYHGGVPIITDVLNENEQGDEIFRARNTSQETFEFIVNELATIEGDLPITGAEPGRATRGAALALKGWCELFNASPLNNTSGNTESWNLAANTYKKIIDMNVYDLFPDYNTLFFEENNNNEEIIWARQHLGSTSLANNKDGEIGPRFVNGSLMAWGQINPTQEIVDEYVMANGIPIQDPSSGYDPTNPYENREKRFYQSIVYDGSIWMNDEMVMKQGVGSPNATDLSNNGSSTKTGYYLRKGVNPVYAIAFNNQNSANWIIFRYAEVLLGYAEAQNEVSGPDASVYKAINKIRQRSELPDLETGLSQDEMRVIIYRERRVELAFEEKRLPDLLRLKLAEVNLNGTTHAMVIEDENYNIKPAAGGTRFFDSAKNYLLPIPQSAMDANPNLTQNPNY